MKTIIIVAMTRDRVIGHQGSIPWHDAEDLKHFKRTTTGHAVIMGRKTYESIGKPLPNRRNIVVTRNTHYAPSNPQSAIRNPKSPVDVAHSLEQAFQLCRQRDEQKAFIIGGAQLYALALPIVDEMIITLVDGCHVGDTRFPTWTGEQWSEQPACDPLFPRAVVYCRTNVTKSTRACSGGS